MLVLAINVILPFHRGEFGWKRAGFGDLEVLYINPFDGVLKVILGNNDWIWVLAWCVHVSLNHEAENRKPENLNIAIIFLP